MNSTVQFQILLFFIPESFAACFDKVPVIRLIYLAKADSVRPLTHLASWFRVTPNPDNNRSTYRQWQSFIYLPKWETAYREGRILSQPWSGFQRGASRNTREEKEMSLLLWPTHSLRSLGGAGERGREGGG